MEAQSKYSQGFFGTMISVPAEAILFTLLRPFPFAGQPVKTDQKAKIVEKYIDMYSPYEHTFRSKSLSGRLGSDEKIETLMMKINTQDGVCNVRLAPSFDKNFSSDQKVELWYQESKNQPYRLKGIRIIAEEVDEKLTFF